MLVKFFLWTAHSLTIEGSSKWTTRIQVPLFAQRKHKQRKEDYTRYQLF